MESLKLFSLYFTLAPKACLGAELKVKPSQTQGLGRKRRPSSWTCPMEPLRCSPDMDLPRPNPVQLLGPSRWAPLLLATEGCSQLSNPHQPTQSGDQGACLVPQDTLGSRRGGAKAQRGCGPITHLCFREIARNGVLLPS